MASALKAHALVKLATIKDLLNISVSDYDTKLEILINMVSRMMIQEIGHNPVYTVYSDKKFDGHGPGRSILLLPHLPIVAVSSITENEITLTEDTDFLVYTEAGYLQRISCEWAEGNQNIVVSYSAGYWVQNDPSVEGCIEIPDDIQLACSKQVGIENKRFDAEDWDRTSQSFPDGSISKNIVELHPQVKDICRKYRRPVI